MQGYRDGLPVRSQSQNNCRIDADDHGTCEKGTPHEIIAARYDGKNQKGNKAMTLGGKFPISAAFQLMCL
jgi:hypothetical protein